MRTANPFDHAALALQIRRQKKNAWDLERSIPWETPIQTDRYLLPLDQDSIAFPGASKEQRLALSQFMGLVINSTISEMENVINVMRTTAWENILRRYPVNPEMWELGDLFFVEETKHALCFERYNSLFCKAMGLAEDDLNRLLPKAYGSWFLKAVSLNSKAGGHAFWWIVASVEEVSIILYKNIHQARTEVDPLYYQVHLRHMEEESRHHNYAFLMLELIEQRNKNLRGILHKATDLLLSQVFSSSWVLAELHKIYSVKEMRKKSPFYDVLASSLPLLEKMSKVELVKRLFVSAPYVSLMLNTRNHPLTIKTAQEQGAVSFPLPKPINKKTFTGDAA